MTNNNQINFFSFLNKQFKINFQPKEQPKKVPEVSIASDPIAFDVDYVFPYVDNSESVWRKSFIDYCKKIGREDKLEIIDGARYTDLGLLPTLIKCIELNLPWVRKIHIIVSNIEQLPVQIRNNPRVHVVLHKDIIPQKFLPTFNSTTIEMFVPRIEGLAEHFIYGNDDMFPLNKLKKADFFSEDGERIKIGFHTNKLKITSNQFRHVCFNNNKLIIDNFGFQGILKEKEYYRPYHSITPCIKSDCIEVLDKCKDSIYKVIKAFRTKNQYNQYIYPVYENFNHRVDLPVLNYKYVGYENSLDEICMAVEDHTVDFICINDTYGNYRDEILKYKEYVKKSFNKRLGLK